LTSLAEHKYFLCVKVTSAKQKHVFEKVCEVKWIKCRSDEDEAAGK